MGSLFPKRRSCFYCGCRSAQTDNKPTRKWHCKHCEAINYLDENGEITDPPTAETNPDAHGPGSPSPALESTNLNLTGTGLFCAQCVRNQHLFTSALASYFPSTDDPNYSAYEKEYPKFRNNLEERYPQVCAKCEPRVKARIRQAGYEAKSDHLRRMMDRSKAGREARKARRWNWRSLLVFSGALGYWASVAGQLAWHIMSGLTINDPLRSSDGPLSVGSCIEQTLRNRRIPRHCFIDLAPFAGLSLVAGILAIWWNPKLRLKVEGRGGRLLGLGEYYKTQLIVTVVRCAFWAVLRDPSSSGLDPALPSALHLFMIFFTILSIIISRRIIQYDTRPLVIWSENTPSATPTQKARASPLQTTGGRQTFFTPRETTEGSISRFPLEKLATPRPASDERAIPTPPPETDDMDWTPSVQHTNFRPTPSFRQREEASVLDGPMPFYGSLPAAPKPPAWNLRNQPTQRPKPIEQVVERNPFHRSPTQPLTPWKRDAASSDTVFAPPKFFPMSDHVASTGLEHLFDRTFTIKSPEDEDDSWRSSQQTATSARSHPSLDFQGTLLFQYLRLGVLLVSILTWVLSQNDYLSIPGNYIEVASLGSASLISGFALLEALKQPIAHWNGMEILVYFAELVAAIHLGGNLPRVSFERQYFDRYGKLLLIFMAVQEALGLLAFYRDNHIAHNAPLSENRRQPPNHPPSPGDNLSRKSLRSRGSMKSDLQAFTSHSPTNAPALSFSSTAAGSSFSSQFPEPQPHYQLQFSSYDDDKNHSFSLKTLKSNESDYGDPLDRDSDTETTMTTATNATNNTIRNIRYGRNSTVNETFFSPKRSELGPGIGGLSLEDRPARRVTRSQTQRLQGNAEAVRRRIR